MIVSGFNQKLRYCWKMLSVGAWQGGRARFPLFTGKCCNIIGEFDCLEMHRSEQLPTHCMFKHWIPKMMCGLAPQLLWEYVSSACHVVRVVKDSRGGPEEGLRSFLSLWHCISIPVTFFCPLIVLAL